MSDDPKQSKPSKPPSIDPNLDEEWKPPARTLDADGRLVGARHAAAVHSAPNAPVQTEDPSGLPRLAALKTGDLELVHDPSQRVGQKYEEPAPYRDEVVHLRSRKGAILAVLALFALGGGGLFYLYQHPRLTASLNAVTPKGPLVISSEPSGAEVWLAGSKVGTTPWAVDNRYAGKTTWEVRAKGYLPKRGTFIGGEETHLEVQLEKADP